ncbi:MAG: glycosyltransferase, partial [Bdellovibrionota bacterium]
MAKACAILCLNMQRSVHFFTPVYFDSPSFLQLRENILKLLPSGFTAHFHLLDDTAGEDPALRGLSLPGVTVLPMPFNLGHQRALVYGLRCFLAEGNHGDSLVVTMDADGEDRPEDLPALFEKYLQNEKVRPIVLAKRTRRKESLFFKTFYFLYKRVFRALTGTLIQTGNFAVLNSGAIAKIIFHPYFDLAYASTLFSLGTNLQLVPCPRGVRYEGRSKMNFSRLAIHGVRMLMPFMDRIAIRGVVAFSLFFGLSVVGCFALTLVHVHGIYAVPNW